MLVWLLLSMLGCGGICNILCMLGIVSVVFVLMLCMWLLIIGVCVMIVICILGSDMLMLYGNELLVFCVVLCLLCSLLM